MSQPQPGAGRPADGTEERVVAEPPSPAPKQVDAEGSAEAAGQLADPAPDSSAPERDAPGSEPPTDGDSDPDAATAPPADTAPPEPNATPEPPDPDGTARPDPQDTARPDPQDTGRPAPEDTGRPAPEDTGRPAPEDTAPPGAADAAEAPAVSADPVAAPRGTDADDTPPAPAGRARGSAAVPGRAAPTPSAPDPTRVEDAPAPTRAEDAPDRTKVEHGPNPTRVETAPRWSGSAAVPPPPARRRAWGESAEPTPVPPVESPEHATPVDPWAGVDTTGWDLHSVELPALPPTLPYTAPWPARPAPPHPAAAHPGPPPHPAAARPVSPPAHTPPYPGPPAARPVSPPAHTPPPAPVAPPRPPKQARPPKQRRGRTPPPVAPPPGWQAPKGYVPVPVRRRRRWPWLLLLSVACCCGVPLWWAQPLSSQYPASASLPDQLDSMRLRQDQGSQAAAEDLKSRVRQADWLAEDTFAGIYTTNDGKRVTLFGSTGFRFSPESDAEAELKRLAGDYDLQPSVTVDTGVRGRHERCAVGRADGDAVVVCTSVDHGSLTTGVFTRLSVDDSGRLLDELRQRVVVPKQS
ncbi:hypothetical protein ABZ541_13965 [Micromonospora sediminicola]|uniref:hypothetical protein n=1 Tax=Micromonospora sediminicola TaxID=946078 RepID=UPI0033D1D8CA